MKLLRSLTVSQAMVLALCSGFAVAILFALTSFLSEIGRHNAIVRDRALSQLAVSTGNLAHVLLQEQVMTTTTETTDTLLVPSDLMARRLAVDGQLGLLTNDPDLAQTLRGLGRSGAVFRTWRKDLHAARRGLDRGAMSPATFLDRMHDVQGEMLALMSEASDQTASGPVAVLLRDLQGLVVVKNATAGAHMAARVVAESASSSDEERDRNQEDLRVKVAHAATLLRGFQTLASRDLAADLTASHRLGIARVPGTEERGQSTPDRGEILARQPQPNLPDLDAKGAEHIEALRDLELGVQRRLRNAFAQAQQSWWAALRQKTLMLLGLSLFFGGVGWLTIDNARCSIRRIVATIRDLSRNASATDIPNFPQKDLSQVTDALRLLRNAHITHARQQSEAERVSTHLDRKLDAVLLAADGGDLQERIDVLGLDAESAVLARGVNRLLDQLERHAEFHPPPKAREPLEARQPVAN